MGVDDIAKVSKATADTMRRAGAAWAVAICVVVLGGMFIVDRFAMSDRWTKSDHDGFEIRLTKETAAYRARVDAAIENLQRRTTDYEKDAAVTSEILKRIETRMAEMQVDLKSVKRGG